MDQFAVSGHYSEEGFWDKTKRYARAVGREGIRNALLLYYAMQEPSAEVPAWAKAVIIGALAYFIFPADAIPDAIPAIGFTDDIAVLAAAVAAVRLNVPPSAERRAGEKIKDWFGDSDG